jgi:endoglycosylceramidase
LVLAVQPVTWGMVFDNTVIGSGFTSPPNGDNNTVLSYHYYCPLYDDSQNATIITRVVCDDVMGPLVYEAIDKDVAMLGGSSMLTEWGA